MNRLKDRELNRIIRDEIELAASNERVLFIDNDNVVREAVYPVEFETGELRRIRERLEKAGVLKAVAHISAYVFGAPRARGPRFSIVEYLPTGQFHGFSFEPARMNPHISDEAYEIAMEVTRNLFENEEGEEEEE